MNRRHDDTVHTVRAGLLACAISMATTAHAAEPVPAPTGFDPITHQPIPVVPREEQEANARLLTASCAACHGTEGYSVGITPVLAGTGKEYFIRQMLDFKSGARPGTVMNHHASGYTEAEIVMMAEYFAAKDRGECGK